MLAIDFGTTRVKVAYLDKGESRLLPIGEGSRNFIPSLFYIGKDGHIEIGDDAASMLDDDPNGVVDTLKRKLRETRIRRNRQRTTPKELLKQLFSWIRNRCAEEMTHIFPEPPTEVVLTYPARYTDVEMNLLRTAAIEVGFDTVELVSEPEAAGLSYQQKVGSSLSSDVVVILDCGGGTADWACLKMSEGKLGLFAEIPPGGDENIGGHDIDEELLKIIRERLEDEEEEEILERLENQQTRVLNQIRSIKEKFSKRGRVLDSDVVRIGSEKIVITPEDCQEAFEAKVFRDLVTNFSKYLEKVQGICGDSEPIVLLVGGTGQLRGLSDILEKRCGIQVQKWMESEFATVQGALYATEYISNSGSSEKQSTQSTASQTTNNEDTSANVSHPKEETESNNSANSKRLDEVEGKSTEQNQDEKPQTERKKTYASTTEEAPKKRDEGKDEQDLGKTNPENRNAVHPEVGKERVGSNSSSSKLLIPVALVLTGIIVFGITLAVFLVGSFESQTESISTSKPVSTSSSSTSRSQEKIKAEPKKERDEENRNYIYGKEAFRNRNYHAAKSSFQSCIAEKPQNMLCHWELGWVQYVLGDVVEAIRIWKKIEQEQPGFRTRTGESVSGALSTVKGHVKKHWEGRWRYKTQVMKDIREKRINISVSFSNHTLQVSGTYRNKVCVEFDTISCSTDQRIQCTGDWKAIQKSINSDKDEIFTLHLEGRKCPTLKRIHRKNGKKTCWLDRYKVRCP